MKLLSIAALSFVAAADVPVFSSNDDYDEINLNIRLLQKGNDTVVPASNMTTAPGETVVYTVSGSMSSTYTTDLTVTALCSSVEAPTAAALKSTTSADTATIDTCAAPASRARKLSTDVSIDQAYSLTFATSAAATSATSTISGPSFASSFAAILNTQLSGTGLTATVSSFTAPTTSTATVTTAAPAATPAAPAPSPSSDASMVKANVALAAVAALFASMF